MFNSNLSNLGEKNVELHMHSIPDFIESAHMKIHAFKPGLSRRCCIMHYIRVAFNANVSNLTE